MESVVFLLIRYASLQGHCGAPVHQVGNLDGHFGVSVHQLDCTGQNTNLGIRVVVNALVRVCQ